LTSWERECSDELVLETTETPPSRETSTALEPCPTGFSEDGAADVFSDIVPGIKAYNV